RAVGGGDVVVDQDPPGLLGAPGLGVGVVVEQAVVGDVLQLRASVGRVDGGERVLGGLVPEVLGVSAEQIAGEQVAVRVALGGVVAGHDVRGAVRAGGQHDVLDVGADDQGEV